ncbi:hypothetical protein GGR54DRAFT_6709 [Hypoxylon sp. NC1633]|nr:hypothetical protein GGR54DRAFT_6709 [Hypoxylon sp. NC1633]
MSHESESEAVAQDFREALQDLQGIDRTDINTLTMIARENTEHALAISGALQEHIKKVVPQKKLVALYVLDSIVKNVGTPYTLYFGRKMYQTYMDAYASVDMATRRKMDEMLRTWKEPVRGSLDTRPVFPPDVTRPIENALIKARTTALQAQREHARTQQQLLSRGRPMSQGAPYRESPTPPGAHRPLPQANGYPTKTPVPATNGSSHANHTQPPHAGYALHPSQVQPPPSRPTPQPTLTTTAIPPQLGGYGAPPSGISVEALKDDIVRLIVASKAQLAHTPHDPSIQMRLRALMDLQSLLQSQNLPQDQLVLVKNQIADLAVTIRAPQAHHPSTSVTPAPIPQPVAVAPPPTAAPTVSLDSLFGAGTLAAIMARNATTTPQASAPYQPPAAAAVHTPPIQRAESRIPSTYAPPVQRAESRTPSITQLAPPPAPAPAPALPSDPMALMNMLRQAGLLPASTPAGSSTANSRLPAAVTGPVPAPAVAPGNVPGHASGPQSIETLTSDIGLKPSSLKQFRPQLLPFLFQNLGPQCTQCGRRFPKDEEGKKNKTAHMDWHFWANQRIADAEKRGHHRSWLVDIQDWIDTRESVDKGHLAAPPEEGSEKEPALQWIPAPDDPNLANSFCSICQEKFETKWLDDAQEFVWMDAIKVGQQIFHASCYQEVRKDGGGTGGKRKAKEDLTSSRNKLRREGGT